MYMHTVLTHNNIMIPLFKFAGLKQQHEIDTYGKIFDAQ